ncbi:hypothetical protein C8R43DRAFT_1020171 [Mycena crocata]|nr:hypothetical protein C8R43DRAFT_1020171 [Mycena crocata]
MAVRVAFACIPFPLLRARDFRCSPAIPGRLDRIQLTIGNNNNSIDFFGIFRYVCGRCRLDSGDNHPPFSRRVDVGSKSSRRRGSYAISERSRWQIKRCFRA